MRVIALGFSTLKAYCANTLDRTQISANLQSLLDDVKQVEENFANVPSKWMCTPTCPCPNPVTTPWMANYLKATSYDSTYPTYEKWINAKFGRTLTTATVAAASTAPLQPIFVSATAGVVTYNNFWDCYQKIAQLDAANVTTNANFNRRVAKLSDNFETFARDVEGGLNCNGVCYPGMFYYFQPITTPPPTVNCINGL